MGFGKWDHHNLLSYRQKISIRPEFKEFLGGKDQGLLYVISLNLKRRHLNESQRAIIAAKLANMPSGFRSDIKPSANLPEVKVISQPEASKLLNVSQACKTLRSGYWFSISMTFGCRKRREWQRISNGRGGKGPQDHGGDALEAPTQSMTYAWREISCLPFPIFIQVSHTSPPSCPSFFSSVISSRAVLHIPIMF
jgi:hypothetical protein